MTRSDKDFPVLKAKIDDLNEALNLRNVKWTEAERSFIIQMKTRIFFSEKQIDWLNGLWGRI